MAASVQFRPQNRDLGMVMREVDEDLAIFLGMRNGEKEMNEHLLFEEPHELHVSIGAEPKPDSLVTLNASQTEIVPIPADDNWLLIQPDTSFLPSVEGDAQDPAATHTEISSAESTYLKSELENTCEDSASLSESSLPLVTSTSAGSPAAVNKRPSSSSGGRKPTPRAATPTGRPALPAKPKPSRASTPTSRTTIPSSKPTAAHARSRSSTPTSRPSIPIISKSGSRSATPTRKPATPSTTSRISAPDRSSSGSSNGLKNPAPSRGTTPTPKSRPSKPSEILSLSHDAPQNAKASMPRRPASASRGRPSLPATHASSSNGKPRQKSCSPAKVRAPISCAQKTGIKMLSKSRGYSNEGDDVNPVLIGTKMVDRVVNMRKLAPPKQDEYVAHENPKKSSQENSGFGRSLSKKSLDMAIRHMDIRIPENLRHIATVSANGVRSISTKSSSVGVSGSPLTSSCDSSKSSI
ncbi:nascent polypeptide-associated complex subunit alpha, muscle-specific form isoform X2 [Sesamum indicum]|uniref:Nascent polypeptide-associated complex subunit alpha, muscle-specific form isoform X2 n=1 Tax=Sesamum indicum TaxID=4182 RepID=A0A6I9T200_SESIN|nr:nascent polypeptide-associated complex subunit alpha, muscle-specific form isoform X2 [Sesamum indicum]